MRIIITTLFVFLATLSYSQKVGTTPLSEIDVEYIQIVGIKQGFKNKFTISIDFGQENKFWNAKDTPLFDKDNQRIVFNSMIDALNFMSQNGYDYVDSSNLLVGNAWYYYYLLRKRK